MPIKPFRGTHDHLPKIKSQYLYIENMAQLWAERYGFAEISTPIFEYLDVFLHTLGNTSDVVTKEMFTLKDRHDDLLALRPEGTAGVMRAVLSNKLVQDIPLKYFYKGPMFRYERPQAGRLRQFHQIGIEHIGESNPLSDADVIAFGYNFLTSLPLQGDITLELNTLGDPESRAVYREALMAYFSRFKSDLSDESKLRLEKNPLRILDSKHETDQALLQDAPRLQDYLNDQSKSFFETIQCALSDLRIPFSLNPLLVRGLDYYCHTAFEFKASHLGAQSAVLAGGRYDGLSQQMQGPSLPSVGWAAGIERLALLFASQAKTPKTFAIIPMGEAARTLAWPLAQALRQDGINIHFIYEGSLKSCMKKANKLNAFGVILMGDDEVENQTATVKVLETGVQNVISIHQLQTHLKAL